MSLTRRGLTLALSLVPGVGGKTITRVLARNDLLGRTPDEFARLSAEALREEYRLATKSAEAWTTGRKRLLGEAADLEKRLDTMAVQVVTNADAQYPRQIEALDSDPPGVLYVYGNARLLDARTFAVLSSRGASDDELAWMEKTAEERVLAGEALVGGHDTPEYQRSSVVPLRWGAPRILVLDRGLFQALGPDLRQEPFAAARLWRFQFDPTTDLVVSPVAPDMAYHPSSNRTRDRLVVGLSRECDFAAVRPGGNMERLAKAALAAGRPVRVCETAAAAQALKALGARISPIGRR